MDLDEIFVLVITFMLYVSTFYANKVEIWCSVSTHVNM